MDRKRVGVTENTKLEHNFSKLFKIVENALEVDMEGIDKKLKERLWGNQRSFLLMNKSMLGNIRFLVGYMDITYGRLEIIEKGVTDIDLTLISILNTIKGIENEGVDVDKIQEEIEKIRKSIDDMKPVTDNIKIAFEAQKRWLGENK